MGTLIGSTFRNALCSDFNGTDEYMSRTGASFSGDTAGAWSFWVKLDAVFGVNDNDVVVGFGVRSGANNSEMFFGPRRNINTGTGTFMAITHRATNAGTINGYSGTTTPLTAGSWHHIIVQSNGTAWSMWVDGTSQTMTLWAGGGSNTGDWYGDVSGSDHSLSIGARFMSNVFGPNYYAGLLDEVVYLGGRIFTSGEVAEIYNGGVRKNPHRLSMIADLDVWWRMGDSRDSATTVFDEIGSNDLTLVNMDASNYVAP
jgi:hypothetical protein